MRTEPSEKEEEGSGRRAGSRVMTNNCKCVEHWTHPALLPSHSWPGPDPCLGPQLGVDADGASSAEFLTRAFWRGCWWERGGPWRSLFLASCMARHASLPSSWADIFSQPCPSCACSHPPWEGKGALGKSLAEHLDSPDCPSSRVPHPLCLHRACCRRLTAPWHRLPSPCMCFPTGLTM